MQTRVSGRLPPITCAAAAVRCVPSRRPSGQRNQSLRSLAGISARKGADRPAAAACQRPAQQAHYSFPARLTRARATRSNWLSEMYPSGVSAAPVVGFPVAGLARQWSSGLFDCLDDCHICCLTYWCPCITFGRIAEMVDRGATSCGTSGALYAVIACLTASQCTWVYSCTYRAMMRAQFGLPEAPCADCLVHLCCEPCALCQQYRELMARGLDPVYGWDFNAAMYPPPVQGMRRR